MAPLLVRGKQDQEGRRIKAQGAPGTPQLCPHKNGHSQPCKAKESKAIVRFDLIYLFDSLHFCWSSPLNMYLFNILNYICMHLYSTHFGLLPVYIEFKLLCCSIFLNHARNFVNCQFSCMLFLIHFFQVLKN